MKSTSILLSIVAGRLAAGMPLSGEAGSTAVNAFKIEEMAPLFAAGTTCYKADSQTLYKDHCYKLYSDYDSGDGLLYSVHPKVETVTAGSCMFSFSQHTSYPELRGYGSVFASWVRDYALKCMEDDPSAGWNAAKFYLESSKMEFRLTGLAKTGDGIPPESS